MLMTKERRSATRSLRGWAISVLQEAGAIRECETHDWMQERADPHTRERAFDIPPGPAGWALCGQGDRRNRGRIELDRRHVPRMSAGLLKGPLMDDFDRFWQEKPLDSALIVPQATVFVSMGISSWTVTPFGVLDATAMRPPS